MKITIPNPCSESWADMTESENGRFCGLCDKIVIDFSDMTDDEVKAYFLNYTSEKTCGHFQKGQVDILSKNSTNFFTNSRIHLTLFIGVLLSFIGCAPVD